MEKATNLDQVESYRPQAAVIFETTLTLKEKEVTVKGWFEKEAVFCNVCWETAAPPAKSIVGFSRRGYWS